MAGESISGQAQLIGAAEATTGDYRWFETVLDRLEQVTLEDIERAVSYTHLRAHETVLDLVCRLLLEKKQKLSTPRHSRLQP